jgi:predicted AAA+ superfamily ATPase
MVKQFPAVLITGAWQTGKTSLLRHLYPSASYLTLELPANAEAARTAPDELLTAYPSPVTIDEIQYAPSLLRHLKVRIDRDRSPGQYLLTGSQVFPLMQGVSESLAGRCAVLC